MHIEITDNNIERYRMINALGVNSYDIIVAYCFDIDTLTFNCTKNINKIFCYDNTLTELILPENLEVINCSNNNLKELILPKNIKHVICYQNNIKHNSLSLPDTIKNIYCDAKILDDLNKYKHIEDIQIYYK